MEITHQQLESDVTYLIDKIKSYPDLYTQKVISILKGFLKHRNIEKMHDALNHARNLRDIPFHMCWDVDARMTFLDIDWLR